MDLPIVRSLCAKCFQAVNVIVVGRRALSIVPSLSYSSSQSRRNVSTFPGIGQRTRRTNFYTVTCQLSVLKSRVLQPSRFQQPCFRSYVSEAENVSPNKSQRPGSRKGPISWKSLIAIAGLGGLFMLGFQYVKREKELAIARERSKSLGKAKLGGDWELVDKNGKPVTNKDFFGKWVLLYFGFTHCPDICPDELEKMVDVVNTVDDLPSVPNLTPVFITVDPDRDTPASIGEYVKEFSPKIIGLSGTTEQINKATRAYRVYYSMGPKDEDNDYIVDHTIIMYLINPDGEFVDYYGQNKNPGQISSSIALHMKKYAAM